MLSGPAPVVILPEVFHVGSLCRADRTGRASLEAFMLSVSRDPEDWSSIARCAGPTWSLRLERAAYLDAMALTDADWKAIIDWGVEAGLATRALIHRAWHYDDEADDWRFMPFADPAAAAAEIEDIEAEDGEVPSETGGLLDAVPGVILTETGMRALERWHNPTDGADGLLILAARELARGDPDLVGVWWDEDHHPEALSCPRGGILPERLDRFEISAPGQDADVLALWRPEGEGELSIFQV